MTITHTGRRLPLLLALTAALTLPHTAQAAGADDTEFAEAAQSAEAFSAPETPTPAVPTLFHVSETVSPGETLDIEGAYLPTNPQVWLQSVPASGTPPAPRRLTVLSGSSALMQAQAPADVPAGLWRVWVGSGAAASNALLINQARPVSLDTPEVAPGGTFRIWGRNLQLPGGAPAVTFIDGRGVPARATVVEGDAYHLTLRAPASLVPKMRYTEKISNGLGGTAGVVPLSLPLAIRTGGSDPWSLGVAWAPDLTFRANVYDVTRDPRLALHAVGDGSHDDEAAIQAAITVAAHSPQGGGVVYLPARTYRLATDTDGPLQLASRVVLMGDGPGKTVVQYGAAGNAQQWGLAFPNVTLSGLLSLTIQNLNPNSKPNQSLRVWNGTNAKLFLKNVEYNVGNGGMILLYCVDDLLISDCKLSFTSTQSTPFWFTENSHVVFRNNTVSYRNGRLYFLETNGGVIEGNHISRDGNYAGLGHPETGGLEVSFSQNLVIRGNTFQVTGPQQGKSGDGETILTQMGCYADIHDVGTLTSAGASSLTDSTKNWSSAKTFVPRSIVAITDGPALGQWRYVVGHTGGTLTLDRPWAVTPPPGSAYALTSWTADRLYVLGNTLTNSVHGIMLYDGGWDSVVAGNTLTDSDGILLRGLDRIYPASSPNTAPTDCHNLAWNDLIEGNTVSNPNGAVHALIAVQLAKVNSPLHGNTILGAEVRHNVVNSSNPLAGVATQAPPADFDGFCNMILEQGGLLDYQQGAGIIGTLFDANSTENLSTTPYTIDSTVSQTLAH